MVLVPFLVWLLCVGIGAIIIGYTIKRYNGSGTLLEGFFTAVATCPSGTKEYIDAKGNTNCCRGEIVNGRCADIACTLSCSNIGVPTCENTTAQTAAANSATYCPRSLPNYFDFGESNKGCTNVRVTDSGEFDCNAKRCKIYTDSNEALRQADSCSLLKTMEETSCPTTGAAKSLVSSGGQDGNGNPLPLLVACTYSTGKSVLPVTCYTRGSATSWATAKYGGDYPTRLAEQSLSLDTMINLCPSSQSYYVNNAAKTTVSF